MFEKIKGKLFKTHLGLLPLDEDTRDLGAFNFWGLVGLYYKRKKDKNIIKNPYPAKNQKFNTCGWTGETSMKELDEGVLLSPRSMVLAGKSLEYVSGDGFSTLRNNEKTLQKLGVAEASFLSENNNGWSDYSNMKYFTVDVKSNAVLHRSKTYLRLYNTNQVDKAIDEGRPISIGIDWYTGFNMSHGFSSPWIINGIKGVRIGGHKMSVWGYNKELYVVLNSFGDDWGDNGFLYIHKDFLEKQIGKYGAYINYDLDLDITKWIIDNTDTLVRSKEESTVYLIIDGKKRPFLSKGDLDIFMRLVPIFHYKLKGNEVQFVDKEILDKVPKGDNMIR